MAGRWPIRPRTASARWRSPVVRAVRVGSPHDADKPKTDKAADRTADSASAATASKPLVSTGVAIAGAVMGIVLLAAIGIALAMASRRK